MLTLTDEEITTIPVKDNGERLIDLRNYTDLVIDPRKESTSKQFSSVRESVVERLLAAQANLGDYRLLIIEGHRPINLQIEYFNEYYSELKSIYPAWSHETLHQEASKYVSPPEIIPPHSTGGAVDITLYTHDGKEVNMGVAVNASPEESKNACFTNAENISEEAKKSRKLLSHAMSSAGFVNYPFEFWHWSYGDKYWAYSTGQSYSLYDSI